MRCQERTGETRTGRGPDEKRLVPEVGPFGFVGHGAQPESIAPGPGASLPARRRGELGAGRRLEVTDRASLWPSLDP